jgi:hypothetical protein
MSFRCFSLRESPYRPEGRGEGEPKLLRVSERPKNVSVRRSGMTRVVPLIMLEDVRLVADCYQADEMLEALTRAGYMVGACASGLRRG